MLPLDPHRFLLLPALHDVRDDPSKRRDRLLKLDGGLGQFLCQILFDTADTHVVWPP